MTTQDLVDALGLLQIEKATLAQREADLRAALLGDATVTAPVTFSGTFYDVTVSPTEGRTTLSMEKAKKLLTDAMLRKISNIGAASVRWNIRARMDHKIAA
jgi:hypothetical protein